MRRLLEDEDIYMAGTGGEIADVAKGTDEVSRMGIIAAGVFAVRGQYPVKSS